MRQVGRGRLDGIDPEEMATDLEASFVEHGMDTVALDAELEVL